MGASQKIKERRPPATFEKTVTALAVGFHVSDDRFHGGATSQLAFDHTEDTALLAGDEDAVSIGCIVAAIALVDIAC
jgi:hypothetical protein